MPTDIEQMRNDPDFKKLPSARQQVLMEETMKRNEAERFATTTRAQGLPGFAGQKISAEPGLREKIARMGTAMAIPTATSAMAEYGGAFVPGVSRLPPQVRGAVGSMIGTGINMATGLEEPSLEQLLASAAVPQASRGAGQVMGRLLPGSKAARAVGLVEEAGQLPHVIGRKVTSDPEALFAEARHLNPAIALTTTGPHAQAVLAREAEAVSGLKFGRVGQVARELDDLSQVVKGGTRTEMRLSPILDEYGRPIAREEVVEVLPDRTGKIPLRTLDTVRQRIGSLIATTSDVAERAELKQLYSGLLSDIETAAKSAPGAEKLLEGIQQQRRVFAEDDLRDLVTQVTSQPRPVDNLQTLNTGRLLKVLKEPTERQQTQLTAFLNANPAEKAEIVALVEDMNRRNVKLMPPSGSTYGSGGLLTRSGGAMVGALGLNKLLGQEVVDPQTAALLTGLGTHVISRALLTPVGRGFLRQALTQSSTLNPTRIALQLAGQGLLDLGGPEPLSQVLEVGKNRLGTRQEAPTTPR